MHNIKHSRFVNNHYDNRLLHLVNSLRLSTVVCMHACMHAYKSCEYIIRTICIHIHDRI